MSLFENANRRGTRAAQPAASAVIIGCQYYVTDESVTERSNGTIWQDCSGGPGALVLVEHKIILANTTTVTFSGLNGNTDGMYLLMLRIKASATGTFLLRPNGATTNLTIARHYNGGSDTTSLEWVISSSVTSGQWYWANLMMVAQKLSNSIAMPLMMTGTAGQTTSAAAALIIGLAGFWNETVANLTSLNVVSDAATGIGDGSEMWLYKYAQA